VEKHKILQANAKTATLANGGHGVNEAENNIIFAKTKNHAAVVDMKTIESQTNVLARKSNEYPKTVSPNLNPTKIANTTDNVKLLDMGNKKKPSRSSLSFFDR
ncbi:chromosome transmission fidelity protein 18-like, partial [Trifolium medium]|nr:chromosome transmission fidelity protein 18-like [Trifolium medium]